MIIELKNISRLYKTGASTFKALNNVSFSVAKGSRCVILGPSGSGKTTLLNLLGGIDYADEGNVFVDGTDLTTLSDSKLTDYRRESVGFIFQFYNLIPNLTVYENVEVSSNICKNSLDIMSVLKAVGMDELKDHFPRQLSGGQQQRVSIARAIVKKPKLLLCDEPTGALDFNTSKEILQLLEEVGNKYETTILIVTHNNALAGIANQIIKLRSGLLVENKINDQIIPTERIEW